MTLSDQLELVRRREQAQRLDQGEAEVLAKLAEQLPEPPELDNDTREGLPKRASDMPPQSHS